jgi:adenylate kinase
VTLSRSSFDEREVEQGVVRLGPPRIVMVGPPGSGKSSQARELASRLGLRHLSSGDMLREQVRRATPLGLRADAFMRAGELVPDALIDLLYEQQLAVAETGFVLDGYPRTAVQARRLLEVLADQPPNLLIQFVVPDDVVVQRLCRRAQCVLCGTIASRGHSSVCRACGGPLQRRDDDRDDVVRARLAHYHALREPLLDALRDVAFRADIDADRCPELVAGALLRLVEPHFVDPAPGNPARPDSEIRLP